MKTFVLAVGSRMITLTSEQSKAVHSVGSGCVAIADPASNERYVLLTEKYYQQLLAMTEESLDMKAVATLVHRAMAEEDANDPLLESYVSIHRSLGHLSE